MKLKRYKPLMPRTKDRVIKNANIGNQFTSWTTGLAANCNAFRALLIEIEKPRCPVKSIRRFARVLKENTTLFEAYELRGWTGAERKQMDERLEAFREFRNRGVDRLAELTATR